MGIRVRVMVMVMVRAKIRVKVGVRISVVCLSSVCLPGLSVYLSCLVCLSWSNPPLP